MVTLKILGSSSKGNCYILETEKESLMLDCGVAYKHIKEGISKNKILVGCLITHSHKDHLGKNHKKILDKTSIYTSKQVKEEIGANAEEIEVLEEDNRGYKLFRLGNFLIQPFDVYHTHNDGEECPCVGYLLSHREIGKILFATDTYKLDKNFNDVDHILIECNYAESLILENENAQERVITSHMSLENLKGYLSKWDLSNTKDITLLHASERNGDKDLFKREIEELTNKVVNVAEKGMILEW